MRTWFVYETIYPVIGEPTREYVGRVEARTEKSALNKATRLFKVDSAGCPVRRRKAENFVVRAIG